MLLIKYKILVRLTPVVDFTSNLQADFASKKLHSQIVSREKLKKSHLNEKADQEMPRLTFT